jgi:hypothetical protein
VGQSPEELRREIEQTRAELSQDLDAIGDRVSPGRMVERRRNRMRNGVSSLRERVMGVPAAVGSTVAAAVFKGSEAEARAASTLQEKAQPLKEEAQNVAREVASGLQEPAQQAAESLKETAASSAESVKESAQSSAQQTKEAGQSAVQDVKDRAPGTS